MGEGCRGASLGPHPSAWPGVSLLQIWTLGGKAAHMLLGGLGTTLPADGHGCLV